MNVHRRTENKLGGLPSGETIQQFTEAAKVTRSGYVNVDQLIVERGSIPISAVIVKIGSGCAHGGVQQRPPPYLTQERSKSFSFCLSRLIASPINLYSHNRSSPGDRTCWKERTPSDRRPPSCTGPCASGRSDTWTKRYWTRVRGKSVWMGGMWRCSYREMGKSCKKENSILSKIVLFFLSKNSV